MHTSTYLAQQALQSEDLSLMVRLEVVQVLG